MGCNISVATVYRQILLLTITMVCLVVTSACTHTAILPAASAAAVPRSTSVEPPALVNAVPGIPNLPDLVTVVPFFWKPHETGLEQTKVIIPAKVNGYRFNHRTHQVILYY